MLMPAQKKMLSQLKLLPLLYLFVWVGGCHKLSNDLSPQILECGDDAPANAVKILDPNGKELSGDQLTAFAIHSAQEIQRVPVSSRGCVSAENAEKTPLAVSTRQEELPWAAFIKGDVPDGTIRLQYKSTLQPMFRCPDFSSGVVASPLVSDPSIIVPHSISVAGHELIQSLSPADMTLPTDLRNGPVTLEISYTDLFNEELQARPMTCSLVLDRTPPKVTMSLATSDSAEVQRVSPFENTTLRIDDSNPEEILYCVHPKDDSSRCEDRAQFIRGGPETSFRAPGEGFWCVIAQSRDKAGNVSEPKHVCALSYQKEKIDAIRNLLARSRLTTKIDPLAAAILVMRAQKIYDTLPTDEEREGLEGAIVQTYWLVTPQLSETQRIAFEKGEGLLDLQVNLAERQWLALVATGPLSRLVLGNEKGQILDQLPKAEAYHTMVARNHPDGRTTWVVATEDNFSIVDVRDGKIKIGPTRSWPQDQRTIIGDIMITWNPVFDEFLLTMHTFTEGYKYYLCSAQSAEPCQSVPLDLVEGVFLHGLEWSSQGQYLSLSHSNLKGTIQVYERRGFGNFQFLRSFPETIASAFVKDTMRDNEYLVLYDDEGFSYWEPRSGQWTREPHFPNYQLNENFSNGFSSTRHVLVRWDPFHIYAHEINSKYFRLHFFDGTLEFNFVDAIPLNPGDFVWQQRDCKGLRPAAMRGSDKFCVRSDVMRFPSVPFEVAGGTSWVYAAFNQGGVGVSNDTVMHHFAAETALKSHATG
ncbi:MAG: hypothetical protein M3Q07_20195, partial [Pseudobdellovibrionaceae bacterium]|nr:hypothetical protein [Pseudobdellovibrionaceae bacterium]